MRDHKTESTTHRGEIFVFAILCDFQLIMLDKLVRILTMIAHFQSIAPAFNLYHFVFRGKRGAESRETKRCAKRVSRELGKVGEKERAEASPCMYPH